MNKTTSIILTIVLLVVVGIIAFGGSRRGAGVLSEVQHVEMRDGVQYVTVTAHGGYSPSVSTAAAGVSTKLVVNTNNTYDCSASLSIPELSYRKILPATGSETIDLGIHKSGDTLNGTCGMGMYRFAVRFV